MTTADAIQHFGGQAALARALGLTRGAVNQWGEYPPITRQYQIQVETGGVLRAEPRSSEDDGEVRAA